MQASLAVISLLCMVWLTVTASQVRKNSCIFPVIQVSSRSILSIIPVDSVAGTLSDLAIASGKTLSKQSIRFRGKSRKGDAAPS
jgi:hypothetical protein